VKSLFKKNQLGWLVLVLLACIAGAWLMLTARAAPHAIVAPEPLLMRKGDSLFVPENSPLRARLSVAAVAQQSGAAEITLPATVEADPANVVNVLTPLTGKLVTLQVRLGDSIKRGQVLATVSSADFAQAVSDARKARDAMALSQTALIRARGVNEAGSNAVKDVEAAESAMAQQAAELQRSETRLRGLGTVNAASMASGLLTLTSPISGTVTALNVAAGAVLNDATASLMTVTNLDRLWVTVNVPEDLLGTVTVGQQTNVVLAAYPDQTLHGKVAFVSAALDADTRRAKARIAFANPQGQLKPNMYATAHIALASAPQPQVPSAALLMNNDSVSVFVESAPWTFSRRVVELGRENADQVRVRKGLTPGERVVVSGGVLLND
jgi:cobalt-zinc-cadmium efflux system membrane fusion protein